MTMCSDGVERELIPVGTRVRHKRHPFTGEVIAHEMHESGVPSAIPYKVYWDQENASVVLGWMWIYPAYEDLEIIEEES